MPYEKCRGTPSRLRSVEKVASSASQAFLPGISPCPNHSPSRSPISSHLPPIPQKATPLLIPNAPPSSLKPTSLSINHHPSSLPFRSLSHPIPSPLPPFLTSQSLSIPLPPSHLLFHRHALLLYFSSRHLSNTNVELSRLMNESFHCEDMGWKSWR